MGAGVSGEVFEALSDIASYTRKKGVQLGGWRNKLLLPSNVLLQVMEFVDATLDNFPNEQISAFILFELIWSLIVLLRHGITPTDIHPGNVGLKYSDQEIAFEECDCSIIFPAGYYVLL